MRTLTLACVCVACAAGPVAAQQRDAPMSLQWWHPVAAAAGAATLMLVDRPVRDFLQDHRSDGLDDFGKQAARMKDQEVFVLTGGGAVFLGAALDEPKVTVTGAQILTAYGLSSLMMIGAKWTFGRSRPSAKPIDVTGFDWFHGDDDSSFPSGSAAVSFSLAATVADAVDRLPVTVLMYGAATTNAWARLNANKHWLSDVAVGALVGITAAKLVNGEWTVFGLELPTIWTDGTSAGMGYTLRFR